jgi:hypothetical protein
VSQATDAGERLLRTLRPAFEEIDAELAALSELRDKPAGSVPDHDLQTRRGDRSVAGASASCCRNTRTSRSRSRVDAGLADVVAGAI